MLGNILGKGPELGFSRTKPPGISQAAQEDPRDPGRLHQGMTGCPASGTMPHSLRTSDRHSEAKPKNLNDITLRQT